MAIGTIRCYDADGNQTALGTTTFTYDLAGRMTSNKIGAATATNYTYDGDNLRRTRATGTTVNTKYSWDTQNPLPELALERNNSNALIRRYVQGPAGPLSMATSATAVFYYHRDALGSVTDVTNTTGAAQWKYDYEPFGAQLAATNVSGGAPTNPARFTGEYLDTELANYHLRARQYDPTTGRLRAVDPAPGAVSDPYEAAYSYVGNMPGVFTDPSGMCWVERVCKAASALKDTVVTGVKIQAGFVYGTAQAAANTAEGLYQGGKYAVTHNPVDTFHAVQHACDNVYARGGSRWDCLTQQSGVTATIDSVKAAYNAYRKGLDPFESARLTAHAAANVGAWVVPVGRLTVAGLRRAAGRAANSVRSAAPSAFTRAEALSGRASQRTVNEIAESMRTNGWQGAPIDVVELNGQRIVVDGHHRLAAARRAGIDVQYQVVDPSAVIGPGKYTSVDDILQSTYSVGRDRLR